MIISRREQNKINSEKRILKASRRLFLTGGYENTMIEDIAQRAEVSKATLYNYFPNKESLLFGIFHEIIDNIEEMVEKNTGGFENSEKMLRGVLEEIVQSSAEYWDLARRITYLNSSKDSVLYDSFKELDSLLISLAASAQQEGIFRKDVSAEKIADLTMGVYLISLFQWDEIHDMTPDEIHEKLDAYLDSAYAGFYQI